MAKITVDDEFRRLFTTPGVAATARVLGAHYARVRSAGIAAGLTVRGRGRPENTKLAERNAEIVELRGQGLSLVAIATRFDLTAERVRQILKEKADARADLLSDNPDPTSE